MLAAILLVLAPAGHAAAQIAPEPGVPNPRLQTVRWQEGQVVQLTALPGTGLTVLFETGERIAGVEVAPGDIDARTSSERDGLLLIPLREGDLGTLGVTTDRRHYRFTLRTGTDLMAAYLVRFVDSVPGAELSANAGGTSQPPLPAAQSSEQVWSYSVRGDLAVRPATINDDGTRTFITFGDRAALPAVFAIGASGDEQLVNGYMRSGVFVIDEVWSELVFRIDATKASARRNAKPDGARG